MTPFAILLYSLMANLIISVFAFSIDCVSSILHFKFEVLTLYTHETLFGTLGLPYLL